MKSKMSWKDYLQVMITIALPIAFQNLLTTTASMVDTIMIGGQGERCVAAVGICSQIGSLFSCYWAWPAPLFCFFPVLGSQRMKRGSIRPLD